MEREGIKCSKKLAEDNLTKAQKADEEEKEQVTKANEKSLLCFFNATYISRVFFLQCVLCSRRNLYIFIIPEQWGLCLFLPKSSGKIYFLFVTYCNV